MSETQTQIKDLVIYDPDVDYTTGLWFAIQHSTWSLPKRILYQDEASPSTSSPLLLGTELLSATGWTYVNWTGDFATGWDHTTGNTTALSNTLAAISGNSYQISLIVTGVTTGTFTVAFGGDTSGDINATTAYNIKATAVDGLVITPTTDFDGAIIISIKQITWELTSDEILSILGVSNVAEAADLLGFVLAEAGKSLVLDTVIVRLPQIYTITLLAGADLATKISNSVAADIAVPGTYIPVGWTLEAVDTTTLKITHSLGKRFTGLTVFGKVGAVETMLRPWSEAYTNVIAETTSILKIYGIDPVNEITIIDLNFKA